MFLCVWDDNLLRLGAADEDCSTTSQLNMKLRKPDWKSLVRLRLQGDPKMEIGYSEVELGMDELRAGIPEK